MNPKQLLAEFIGTFTLIFVGVLAISHGGGNLTSIALAHGLAIAVMVSATAAISGGHLNPAVTLGALVGAKIKPITALYYMIAQFLGGIGGAVVAKMILVGSGMQLGGIPAPGNGVSVGAVIAIEAVMTFFLVFVVYGTAIDARAPKVGGLFIGLTVAMDIMAGGPISGAAMNPARHLGPAIILGGKDNLGHIWIYIVGPMLGGAIAGFVYSYVLEDRK